MSAKNGTRCAIPQQRRGPTIASEITAPSNENDHDAVRNNCGVTSMRIIARITFKSEAADEARTILSRLAENTGNDAGCVSCAVYPQADRLAVLQTVEE